MKVLSLFSGVGGFDLGLERAGMETIYQCEWDKHATKMLQKHWPDVPKWGDISTLTAKEILSHGKYPDVVAWGSPCQDLSVAGKRAGLEGSRSGLFHEGIRIIKELREETNNEYPRISIWENVVGALNSNKGADFGVIIDEMAEAGALVQEWRVLDAQYFGVPQRRRRVFLVSIFDPATAERCPDPLLPLSESMRGDLATRGQTRQTTTSETTTGFGSSSYGGWTQTDTAVTLSARDNKSSNTVAVESFTGSSHAQYTEGVGTIRANGGDIGGGSETLIAFENSYRDAARIATEGVSNTLSAKMGTGGNNTPMVAFATNQRSEVRELDDKAVALTAEPGTNQQTYIAFSHTQGLSAQPSEEAWPTLRTEGGGQAVAFPIQDGREIEKNQNGIGVAEDGSPSYTLDQTGAQAVAYGIQGTVIGRQHQNGPGGKGHTDEDDPMYTLTANDVHAVATIMRMREGKEGGGKGPLLSEDKSLTLATSNDQTVFQPHATAFQPGTMIRMSGGVWDELAPTLRAEAKRGDNEPHVLQYDGYNQKIHVDEPSVTLRIGRDSSDFVAQPVAFDGYNQTTDQISQTIRADKSDGDHIGMVFNEPIMAVRRLTPLECERLMGWPDNWTDGQSDTHRYKQCGNGVASPVATWIAQHILKLDQ